MAGVSDTGFTGKTYPEVIEELSDRAKSVEYFGEDFPTTPDSVFGVLAGIFSGGIIDVWALGQAIAAQQNRDTATGIYLNYLAKLVGLSRLLESNSNGLLLFTGNSGATITSFFPCSDDEDRNVITDEPAVLNRNACYQSTFSVNTVAAATDYTINVQGTDYSYTSTGSPTAALIIAGLASSLSASIIISTEIVDETIIITYSSVLNLLSSTNSINITLDSVGTLVPSTAATSGPLTFPADTITTLVGSNVNITSVTNLSSFTIGRDEETDEELRTRMSEREESTGTATKPAIEASISEIEGITSVLLEQNQDIVTDVNGVPAKAYETFVEGGSEEDIAQVLFRTKPAGILTYGDIIKAVTDDNGDVNTVSFSRPTPVYAWMRVTYAINSEEVFPTDGTTQMKDAVVLFGNNMEKGEDYETTKFFGPLYTIPGMYVSLIEIDTTALDTDTPSYGTSLISVAKTEALLFDASRVVVQI